jgi:thiaminase/transcriptional activator TenA
MTFIEELWQRGKPVLERMIDHPFNQQLASGTLPEELFHCYLQQDQLYIREYTQVLFTLLQRTDDADLQQDLQRFATEGAQFEQEMHQHFFTIYSIESAEAPLASCNLYARFLRSCAEQESIAVALAALLPCFWFYHKVGQSLLENSCQNNPYHAWIDTYSGTEFQQQVEKMQAHVEHFAARSGPSEQQKMIDSFLASSLLELCFWEAIYRRRT